MTVEPPNSFSDEPCNDQAPSVKTPIAMDMEPPILENPKLTEEEQEPLVPESSELEEGE